MIGIGNIAKIFGAESIGKAILSGGQSALKSITKELLGGKGSTSSDQPNLDIDSGDEIEQEAKNQGVRSDSLDSSQPDVKEPSFEKLEQPAIRIDATDLVRSLVTLHANIVNYLSKINTNNVRAFEYTKTKLTSQDATLSSIRNTVSKFDGSIRGLEARLVRLEGDFRNQSAQKKPDDWNRRDDDDATPTQKSRATDSGDLLGALKNIAMGMAGVEVAEAAGAAVVAFAPEIAAVVGGIALTYAVKDWNSPNSKLKPLVKDYVVPLAEEAARAVFHGIINKFPDARKFYDMAPGGSGRTRAEENRAGLWGQAEKDKQAAKDREELANPTKDWETKETPGHQSLRRLKSGVNVAKKIYNSDAVQDDLKNETVSFNPHELATTVKRIGRYLDDTKISIVPHVDPSVTTPQDRAKSALHKTTWFGDLLDSTGLFGSDKQNQSPSTNTAPMKGGMISPLLDVMKMFGGRSNAPASFADRFDAMGSGLKPNQRDVVPDLVSSFGPPSNQTLSPADLIAAMAGITGGGDATKLPGFLQMALGSGVRDRYSGAPGAYGMGGGAGGAARGLGGNEKVTIAQLEADPATQAKIRQMEKQFPNVKNLKTQLYSMVAGESSFRSTGSATGSYSGYFQLGSDVYGPMGLTKEQFTQLPFNEQLDAYSAKLQREKFQGNNLGLYNAAGSNKWQNMPDDTVIYPANSDAARGNAATWGRYSNAGGNITIGGIKAYYGSFDASVQKAIGLQPDGVTPYVGKDAPAGRDQPAATRYDPNQSQANRPQHYGGDLQFEGKHYPFGTGATGRYDSSPYGDFPLGDDAGPKGKGGFGRGSDWGAIGVNHNTMVDPKTGRTREGIELHASGGEDADRILTEGCIAIAGSRYKELRNEILRRTANGEHLYLHMRAPGPDGKAIATIDTQRTLDDQQVKRKSDVQSSYWMQSVGGTTPSSTPGLPPAPTGDATQVAPTSATPAKTTPQTTPAKPKGYEATPGGQLAAHVDKDGNLTLNAFERGIMKNMPGGKDFYNALSPKNKAAFDAGTLNLHNLSDTEYKKLQDADKDGQLSKNLRPATAGMFPSGWLPSVTSILSDVKGISSEVADWYGNMMLEKHGKKGDRLDADQAETMKSPFEQINKRWDDPIFPNYDPKYSPMGGMTTGEVSPTSALYAHYHPYLKQTSKYYGATAQVPTNAQSVHPSIGYVDAQGKATATPPVPAQIVENKVHPGFGNYSHPDNSSVFPDPPNSKFGPMGGDTVGKKPVVPAFPHEEKQHQYDEARHANSRPKNQIVVPRHDPEQMEDQPGSGGYGQRRDPDRVGICSV